MSAPLVSVVIPIYNVSRYLVRCLDSIVEQTYQKLEIILVDDGSFDGSEKICNEYAQKDNRIKVIHKINGGLSDARNAGIKIATGEFIAFVDADDYVSRKYVQILLDMIIKEKADIAICKYEVGARNHFSKENSAAMNIQLFEASEMLKNWHGGYKHIETVAWNKLYKLSLFKENGITYPIGYYNEDVQTTHLLINKAKHIVLTDAVLYYYFQRKDSITGDISDKKIEDNICSQKIRMKFFVENDYQDAYERLAIKLLKYYMLMFFETNNEKMKAELHKRYLEDKFIVGKSENLLFWEKILFNIFEGYANGLRKIYRLIKQIYIFIFTEHKKCRK